MRRLAAAAMAVLVVAPAAPAAADTVVVRTRAELLQALAAAVPGDTVSVDGAAVINLTGTKEIAIPAGVTLASNRGQNGAAGALLYTTELDPGQRESWAQFVVRGSGARVTGLRLRGPDQEIRNDAYEFDNSDGIMAVDASDVTVDNNELWGWSHGAVYLVDTIEGRVSRNDIHHNRRTGLGYGVVLHNDSSAVIELNTFRQNRHAIAASGIRTQRYDARFNLVVDNARSHGFDMHGENEALGNGAPYAGDVIHINRNSFRSAVEPAVAVRGRPATGAWVSRNCFAHGGAATAVIQRHFSGNLFVGTNTYGTTTANCHAAGSARPAAWQLSAGGTESWAPLAPYTFDVSEVGFGDFDGDGRTDVLRATGKRWYYSPAGRDRFVPAAVTGLTRAALRFGDFDGDRRTDVFSVQDGQWRFSAGAAGAWQPLASSGVPLADLRFGDFDGDGRTDVFSIQDGRWRYSAGGRSSWLPLASSGIPLESLGFGDFDGDGRSDVFSVQGGRWFFSSGGAESWTPLAASPGVPLADLRFGDFDGDGRTDVFYVQNGRWFSSPGGAGPTVPLASSGCPVSGLTVADFTGDGRADVFDGRCGT